VLGHNTLAAATMAMGGICPSSHSDGLSLVTWFALLTFMIWLCQIIITCNAIGINIMLISNGFSTGYWLDI